MSRPRHSNPQSLQRQGGAVAIIVALCLTLLVGMLGFVLDLGHLYLAKTELQNAADGAALSGAKELNGTLAGVNSAVAWATSTSPAVISVNQNKYDLNGKVVTFTPANLEFSNSPAGPWVGLASAQASPANKTFLKVDSGLRSFDTWLIHVLASAVTSTQTFGMAVAGRYTIQISPMAVCSIDKNRPEQGFVRGVAYNLPDLNPMNNGDPIWINPVDSYPGACDTNHGNTGTMTPFVCTGNTTTISTIPGEVWVNTGAQAVMNGPLNSRFGDNYSGGQACDPVTAPPDFNVKEFFCTQAKNPNKDNYCSTSPGTNAPQNWVDIVNTPNQLLPFHQSIETLGSPKQGKPFNYPTRLSTEIASNFAKYGVLWSYSREVKDFTTSPYTNYALTDWPQLYGGAAESYPNIAPATSPYLAYVEAPVGVGAPHKIADRRVLNLAIIDCPANTSIPGQQCSMHLPVLAIGKFFMQRRAELPQKLTSEFAGIFAPPLPPTDIRLYR